MGQTSGYAGTWYTNETYRNKIATKIQIVDDSLDYLRIVHYIMQNGFNS